MGNTESVDTLIENFQQRLEENDLSKYVKVDLTNDKGAISLDQIRAEPRRQGYGGRALELLLSLCDGHKVVIKLIPHPLSNECLEEDGLAPRSPQDNMSKEQLEKWYKHFGFEYGTDKTAEGVSVMLRKPIYSQ